MRIQEASVLQGRPVSPGVAEGKAFVISDFHGNVIADLEATASSQKVIVIVRHLSPEIIVVFGYAAGVIAEYGGVAGHGAILCREFGIPCIVGVSFMPDVLGNGATVSIDGSTGIAKVVK